MTRIAIGITYAGYIIALAIVLAGCSTLSRELDKGTRDGPPIMGVRTTYYTSPTHAHKAYCSGRPLTTTGVRARCGLQPL
jgi:starvation-inducible outer membrane lipoprotein